MLKASRDVLASSMQQLIDAIATLAQTHANQPMLSRTQVKPPAPPHWAKKWQMLPIAYTAN